MAWLTTWYIRIGTGVSLACEFVRRGFFHVAGPGSGVAAVDLPVDLVAAPSLPEPHAVRPRATKAANVARSPLALGRAKGTL